MTGTIIYLEDDEMLALVTTRSLQNKGFNVFHFSNSADFSEKILQLDFDYALLDLKIGNETSLQLIRQIKSVKDVPVVILTGYGTIQTAVRAMQLGAINFLSKPCDIDEIVRALQEQVVEEDVESAPTLVTKPSLRAIEWETIQRTLDENQGNVSATARQLKMHRRTLQRKLSKRHIE